MHRPRHNGPKIRLFAHGVLLVLLLDFFRSTHPFRIAIVAPEKPLKEFALVHLGLDDLVGDLGAPYVFRHEIELLVDQHRLVSGVVVDRLADVDLPQTPHNCGVAEAQGAVQVAAFHLGHQGLVCLCEEPLLYFADIGETGHVLVLGRVQGHVLAADCEAFHVFLLALDVDDEGDAGRELLHEFLHDPHVQMHAFYDDAVAAVVVVLDYLEEVLVDLVALFDVALDAGLFVSESLAVDELACLVGGAEEHRQLVPGDHIAQYVANGVRAQHAGDAQSAGQQRGQGAFACARGPSQQHDHGPPFGNHLAGDFEVDQVRLPHVALGLQGLASDALEDRVGQGQGRNALVGLALANTRFGTD